MKFKIALIQAKFTYGQVQNNVQKAERLVRDATTQGANFVCLPEFFNQGYDVEQLAHMSFHAEHQEGNTLKKMCALAKELHIYLIAPMLVSLSDNTRSNRAFLISDEGKVVGFYTKTHPTRSERGLYTSGSEYPVFDTKYGRVGIMICNDIRFMEVGRLLGIQKADIIFAPAAWRYFGDADSDEWILMLRSHAINNRALVAAVNHVGPSGSMTFSGNSMFIDPNGYILQKCGFPSERILIQEYSLEQIREAKKQSADIFIDRKPNEYGLLCRSGV